MALGSVSFTLGGADRIAFAVYSADDGSLNFYKRMDIPEASDTLEGKTVTKVYTGFEEHTYEKVGYTQDVSDNERWSVMKTNVPWFDIRDKVTTVKVIDSGVAPKSIKYWFYRFSNLKNADLSNLEVSRIASIYYLFVLSANLISIKMPGLTGTCTDYKDSFSSCPELTSLEMSTCDFSNCNDFYHMFNDSKKLKFDCSDWNVPVNADHEHFNYNAPGVILPKPWQPTAFAVFSANDGSLDFYKREFKDLPKSGDTFDGEIVTSVYTGFEEGTYAGTWPNDDCPWFSIATKVKSVTVVDAIRPKSMAWWFNQFCNCKSFDLGNIDTSDCVSFRRLFSTCTSCISISGLDRWDTGSVVDLSATFDGLRNLTTIPRISSWDTSRVKYFASTFYNLDSLERLDLSNWDDSSLTPDTIVGDIGDSGKFIGNKGGLMKTFKSFTVSAKWSHTAELAWLIGLASGGTIPTDGKWYAASDGTAYGSADVPSNKADTYYATSLLKQAIAKDAKNWTLGEQKAVAEDIAAKGEASPAYVKAKAAMDAGTKFSMKLTNGQTLEYRIIGINHDDLADGNGKAGLTFLTTSTGIMSRVNATNTNVGGWEKSELRAKMNSGEIWNLMPSEFQSKVKTVRKLTNNVEGGWENRNAAVTATSDKLFLLSYSEIVPTSYWASSYPWSFSEGTQYEAFKGKVTENCASSSAISIGDHWWERSVDPDNSTNFLRVNSSGDPLFCNYATCSYCVCPAFSF